MSEVELQTESVTLGPDVVWSNVTRSDEPVSEMQPEGGDRLPRDEDEHESR